MWDIVTCDYDPKLSPKQILDNVFDYVRPGSIITFHDSIKTVDNLKYVLPRAITSLKMRGYCFETIDDSTTKSRSVFRNRLNAVSKQVYSFYTKRKSA